MCVSKALGRPRETSFPDAWLVTGARVRSGRALSSAPGLRLRGPSPAALGAPRVRGECELRPEA